MSSPTASKELSATDAAFILQCLRDKNSSMIVNVPAVAASINAKPHAVTCRVSSLRKRYGLNIACTSSASTVAAVSKATSASAAGIKARVKPKLGPRIGGGARLAGKNGIGTGNGLNGSTSGGKVKSQLGVGAGRKRKVNAESDADSDEQSLEDGAEEDNLMLGNKKKKVKPNESAALCKEEDDDVDGEEMITVKDEAEKEDLDA